jgi:hypothetical protein
LAAAHVGRVLALAGGLGAGLGLATAPACGPSCNEKYEGRRYDLDRDCLLDPEPALCSDDRSCRDEPVAYLDSKGSCYLFICDPGEWEGWRRPPPGNRCTVAFLMNRSRCSP